MRGEEALERGLLALLVLQREIEELGEDVVDLVAEARVEALEAAAGVEHVGVELERPVEIEPVAPAP